jgi:hypothetical protein
MPLIIPVQTGEFEAVAQQVLNRFTALLAVDVTDRKQCDTALLSADISSGEGTIVFVDIISPVLDKAR